MVIEGIDHYRVVDPLFECVRIVLAHRGDGYSPAYIQGISGTAFRIAGPCPCAPTCSLAMSTPELVALLGYQAEHISLADEGIDPQAEVHALIARVKDEVRAGRPAIVWHAFTNAEWDVVCGFDVASKEFIGRGSYLGVDEYARAEEARTATCVDICPPLGALIVGDKLGPLDARERCGTAGSPPTHDSNTACAGPAGAASSGRFAAISGGGPHRTPPPAGSCLSSG